ncbi:hypothetical protein RJT34_30894 [Clitoria ternatea]|uniref:Uncharacterized protein n=1 Tax=Clitoria ternatea TaxID=43366 RepID=A0AAN9I7U6_CLITE
MATAQPAITTSLRALSQHCHFSRLQSVFSFSYSMVELSKPPSSQRSLSSSLSSKFTSFTDPSDYSAFSSKLPPISFHHHPFTIVL